MRLLTAKSKGVSGRRQFDFVVDQNGKLIIGDKHHMLGNGQDVKAAGQMRLNGQGQVRHIDNLSGHYQPTPTEAANYPQILSNAGLNVPGATMVTHGISTNASGWVTGTPIVSTTIIK